MRIDMRVDMRVGHVNVVAAGHLRCLAELHAVLVFGGLVVGQHLS